MQSIAVAIKTIPDIEAGKRLYKINNLSDEGVAKAMFHLQQQKADSENLPHYLQQIIAIAVCYEKDGKVQTEILSGEKITEKELLESYVALLEGKQQVTWNGNDFEFPVLQYRALKQGVSLADLAHRLDLSSNLAANCKNEAPSLYEISCFLKLPELQKGQADYIWNTWQNKEIDTIYTSVKRDVENVYQVFKLL